MIYLLVGLGGVVGSLLRYFVSSLSIHFLGTGFPFGTVFVNLTGAFVLGWITGHLTNHTNIHPYFITAIGTGVVGSYTTFSTLSVETITFIEEGLLLRAFIYIIISLIGGIAFASWGFHFRKGKIQGENG
ncbi:fluoride efflux transporter CrcB [Bacillus massilinigeriensis]|uniref:fluoride efflux transporter CrcB n=1 Tax=Bacillus massilionigeriensis TaxID=1805475 RepID=UPI00096B6006|nr:fluoride efflux transporter CrcB [Bacillus massilionigeriensis]